MAEYIKFGDFRFDGERFAFGKQKFKLEFETEERFERAKAMIEFCTKYEKESFELFYKWFKEKDRKEEE